MNMKRYILLFLLIPALFKAQSPGTNITSWSINNTGHQAQYYDSDGITVVNLNDSSAVQQVCYNTDSIYVRTNILGAFTMGPWTGDPFLADGQNNSYVFPRNPTYPSSTHQTKPTGAMALQVNGVIIYDDGDGKSYNTSTNTNSNSGAGVWNQIAWVAHAGEMDAGNGHPDPNSVYHNHHNPIQLCSVTDATSHSPIIGWSFDGWPIYGPFGYSTATDNTSAIARMTSSWSLRNITTRTTFYDGSTASQTGPAVSATFPLGTYIEDYEYTASAGDLDYYNGRYCVTPEYPSGTYAYFLNTDATGDASYPNMIGPKFYGSVFLTNFGGTSGAASAPSVGVSCYTPNTGCSVSLTGSTNVTCNGGATGSATVSVTGSTGTVVYSWAPSGGTAATASNLSAGTYTVSITDDGGCAVTQTVTITEPVGIAITSTVTNVSCNAGTDGAINVTASSGNPYGSSSPGLLISEVHANPNSTDSPFEFVEMVATKTIDFTTTPYTVVFANNGTATTNGWKAGAALTYAFQISTGSVTAGQVVYVGGSSMTPTSNVLRSINTGTTAGDGAIGTANTNGVLGNGTTSADGVAVFNVGTSSLTSSSVPVDAIFYGAAMGNAVVSSGTAGYQLPVNDKYTGGKLQTTSFLAADAVSGSYLKATGTYDLKTASFTTARTWANTTTFTDLATSVTLTNYYDFSWTNSAATEDVTALGAGTYTVTVTDASGCSKTSAITITEPTAVSGTASATNVNCFGQTTGAIDLTPAGGNGIYTYTWSNSQTTQDLSSIGSGTYSVTIKDGNLCTGTVSVTVTSPSSALSASVSTTNATCAGGDGAADLTVSGGTAGYSYSWSNLTSSEDLSGTNAGTYSVTVTDANSCTVATTATIGTTGSPTLSTTVTNAKCNGDVNGAVDLTVSGGTSGYSYSWSNSASSEDLSGIGAGTYSVTVTDASSCTATVSVNVTEPTALTATATATDANCNGESNGSVDLTVSGGTTSYSFLWSTNATTEDISSVGTGTYSVTITDANNCTVTANATVSEPSSFTFTTTVTDNTCNGGTSGAIDLTVSGGTSTYTYSWSNSTSSEDLSGVGAGTYSVTVTDSHSCTTTTSAAITEPDAIQITSAVTDALCNGGSNGAIDVTTSGGTAGYTYTWSTTDNSEDISSLAAGDYSLSVTDNNSCTATFTITVSEPGVFVPNATSTSPTCYGLADGVVTITPSGGTSPYTFDSQTATSFTFTALSAGTYTFTGTDANGCADTANVTLNQPDTLTASAVASNSSCNGNDNGSIDVTVSGGTSGYTYAWITLETTEDLSGLAPGTYSVDITDANGCVTSASATVSEPTALSLSSSVTDEFSGNDGAIDLTVSGGISSYTYAWSNLETTEDLTGLAGGDYTITVTDDNGCTITDTITVNTTLGMASSVNKNVIRVYPNPATSTIIIAGNETPAKIEIRDAQGKLVFSSGGNINKINISEFSNGIYTVSLIYKNKVEVTRLVKN
jgi:hypothetical protein